MATANLDSNFGVTDPFAGVDFGQLEHSLRRPRTLMDFLLSGLVTAMTLSALVPLFSVIWMLAWRGGKRLSLAVFTQLPPSAMEAGGGFGNAIIGTLADGRNRRGDHRPWRCHDGDLSRAESAIANLRK